MEFVLESLLEFVLILALDFVLRIALEIHLWYLTPSQLQHRVHMLLPIMSQTATCADKTTINAKFASMLPALWIYTTVSHIRHVTELSASLWLSHCDLPGVRGAHALLLAFSQPQAHKSGVDEVEAQDRGGWAARVVGLRIHGMFQAQPSSGYGVSGGIRSWGWD